MCFEQCLDLDFIAKVAVSMWLCGQHCDWEYQIILVYFSFLDSSVGTLARTYIQSTRAELTVERLHLNRNWLFTGLFSSNPAVQIQLSVSLKKFGVPKYVPQCNWHGAQAHTWAMGYLWNLDIHRS